MITDEEKAILAERARALATPLADDRVENGAEVVVFTLDGERYALESHHVREVLRRPEVARLPGAEPPVLGLTTWRGGLLTIIAIGRHSGLAPRPDEGSRGFLMVLVREGDLCGVLVDGIEGVASLDTATLRGAPLALLEAAELIQSQF